MSKQTPKYLEQPPNWSDDERPVMPGSPPVLDHTQFKRYAYFIIGTFIALTASLSNGFITANLPQLQGEYGLTPSESAWLPAVYVMANVSANLVLFKTRQQYGLRLFTEISLICFITVMILHLLVQDGHMALVIRCISGFVAAPLSSLGMYYIMQSFGKVNRLKGIYVGFGFNQLGIPLAWIISPFLINANQWVNLYTFELGLAICCFAMVVAVKLPRGVRIDVIEKKDFITFLLLAPGFACLCAVLSQGPILWWFDSTWLAYVLITGFSLVVLGFFFEHQRTNPLILTRWLGTASVIRFVIGAFFLRFLLSEQSFTAVNFLKTMGIGQDQFIGLYSIIFIGILSGTLFSAITFSKNHIFWPLLLATLLILVACRLDAHLTSDVRPNNFFYSQFLIAFANGLFIGPLLLTGMVRALKQGTNYVLTFIILFSATQNFGSLVGSSFYNTYQKHQAQVYQLDIEQTLNRTDPNVTNRIHQYTAVYSPHITDNVLEQAQATQLLAQVVNREAQVRAYNDVVNINSLIAILLFLWTLTHIVWQKYSTQRK
ncbi:MFS transporter [Acinetobacter boissieri]|uniref:Major Facilitator Superfamily protein n=1 Tax=Acinetobacter boissieri TaxID=1219383 RepID=A0A1G6JWQ6_9GAMM|nr:MFS transporter [Acinetobacter boissieri]SDC23153.1 Major Facilitator Superfamily protein [Acinetobacter boissieri]